MAEKIRVMIPEDKVDARIKEIGEAISKQYEGEEVHLICVLRGGSEALLSNAAVCDALNEAAIQNGIPAGAIQLLRDTDRAAASEMMKLNGLIDVLIPRGGKNLRIAPQ